MKNPRLFNAAFFLLLLSVSFTLVNCGNSETEGCTNSFAANYDSEASVDCCCEYDVEALVNNLTGTYDLKLDNSDLTKNFSYHETKIEKDPNNANGIIIKDFFYGDLFGNFENGAFSLESEIIERFGCTYRTTGALTFENNVLKFDAAYRGWGVTDSSSQFTCDSTNEAYDGEFIKK